MTSLPNPYTASAQTALNTLTSQWFTADTPGQWVPEDYWRTPTICRTLIAAMEQFNTTDYVATMVNAYNAGNGYTDTCGYYDDLSVWGGMYTKGYFFLNATGDNDDAANFLSQAQEVCSQLKAAADNVCGGGDWWMRNPPSYPDNFKAANATLGWAEAAIDLYNITGDATYLEDAKTAIAWVIGKQLINKDGAVWGGLTQNCVPDPKNVPVIALQGNPQAPLWSLYKATGDSSYVNTAMQIVDWTLVNFVFPSTGVFMTAEDSEWNSQPLDWQVNNSGPCLFKGIFSMYLGALTVNLLQSKEETLISKGKTYAAALQQNANALMQNYPGNVFGMNWNLPSPSYTPTGDGGLDAVLQYSGCSLLLSATTVTDQLNQLAHAG